MKSMMPKEMWMGRATVFLVGLAAIIAAAVFGISSAGIESIRDSAKRRLSSRNGAVQILPTPREKEK